MKIECPGCHKKYNIPKERLPKDRQISIACPACKTPIKISVSKPMSGAKKEPLSGGELKKSILKSVRDLPPMPEVVYKAKKVMADINSSFADLAIVLVTDQAIATRVLKLANSVYYGLSGTVSSIQQASVVLGQKTLSEILTMASASQLLDQTMPGYGLDPGQFWRHSLLVAFGARIVTGRIKPHLAEDAFAAGLTHDAGKLVLDPYIHERAEVFDEFMAGGQKSFLEAEKQILGFDHCEIAAEVCKAWKMPENITLAIRFHHYPSRSDSDHLAYSLHVADSLSLISSMDIGLDALAGEMETGAPEFLDLLPEDMDKIERMMIQSVKKTTQTIHE